VRIGTIYRADLVRSMGLAHNQGRILDIGGYDGFMLSRLDASQKVSVDIQTLPLHEGIDYCLGDGLQLPFRDNSFETIYALDVLEHVDDERRFASELLRVLKPGGRLILTTPQYDIAIFPGLLQGWVNRKWQHFKVSGYRQESVEALFEALKPRHAVVIKLSTPWFLKLYLPLSLAWRLAPAICERFLRAIARLDCKCRGSGGYLLAEVIK
jgi:ubiquinone/menaquinone biosynthesis C-methylase UbiE